MLNFRLFHRITISWKQSIFGSNIMTWSAGALQPADAGPLSQANIIIHGPPDLELNQNDWVDVGQWTEYKKAINLMDN